MLAFLFLDDNKQNLARNLQELVFFVPLHQVVQKHDFSV